MYIPPQFALKNKDIAVSFMRQYPFAIIFSQGIHGPEATHLPFTVEEHQQELYLTSHLAIGNPQWKSWKDTEVLVVFHGPHAYISPQHYTHAQNVPTWNYMTVHAYGVPELISETPEQRALQEQLIAAMEPNFHTQWEQLDPHYVHALFKGIMGFRIKITRWEAQFKLSQNKPHADQVRIIEALKQGNSWEQDIAKAMEANLNTHSA